MLNEKIAHSLDLVRDAVEKYPKIGVACSFGKDSAVVVHLAQTVKEDIPVFAVMTRFKPKETFEYKDMLIKEWNLNLKEYSSDVEIPEELYKTDPDECCRLLKVEPTKEAVKDMDCWICGLRSTEGRTRTDYEEIEFKGGLVKLNPILTWTEVDIWKYMAVNKIPVHPLYLQGYRSLGCSPCSNPGGELERDGRWKGTSKCGGECGIHTQDLK
ncbi:MAG: phosphoadenylyl-sulfate reductase [Candidatus Omnitrophota bacterium]